MAFTRRDFGKMTLAGLPAAALFDSPLLAAVLAQGKPNSKFGGVQLGVITYSYRSMADQSAEATLKYVVDSGISAIELMDGPVENFPGRAAPPAPAGGAGRGGAGRGRRSCGWGTGRRGRARRTDAVRTADGWHHADMYAGSG